MTTIAWDGKTLAADSMASSGGVVISRKYKKLHFNIGKYKAVAFAGTNQDFAPVLEWLKTGESKPVIKNDFSVICIDKKGVCYFLHEGDELSLVAYNEKLSAGSGAEIAIGAMDGGATAVEAVKIACNRDLYSGGKVQSYTFMEGQL